MATTTCNIYETSTTCIRPTRTPRDQRKWRRFVLVEFLSFATSHSYVYIWLCLLWPSYASTTFGILYDIDNIILCTPFFWQDPVLGNSQYTIATCNMKQLTICFIIVLVLRNLNLNVIFLFAMVQLCSNNMSLFDNCWCLCSGPEASIDTTIDCVCQRRRNWRWSA